MLKTHLKMAWQNLWKNRFYSTINIVGMTVAITCLLLAVMYWDEEHGYDDFHTNNPNLYRITTNLVEHKGAIVQTVGTTGQIQGRAFKEAVPEIRKFTRVMGGGISSEVSTAEKTLLLNTLFVDTSFFEVFTFPLVHGTALTALKDVNGAVLSASTAMRLFNSTDVVGRVLRMESDPSYQRLEKPLVVSAIAKDPPKNSSIQFDILLPFEFLELAFTDTNWLNTYLGTFVVLEPASNRERIEQQFNRVFATHARDQVEQNIARYGFDSKINYGLQNISDVHLEPLLSGNDFNGESGIVDTSTPIYSIAFLVIALLILILASINFINITIATALNRAKEIGIRKISGSNKIQIIFQFLLESGLLCGISFLLSLLAIRQLIPIFNSLTAKQFAFEQFFNIEMGGYLLLIFGSVILITGLYPAFVLSRFQPSEVLYNKLKQIGQNVVGRGLIVFQFSLGIFLLIVAIVFHSQMDYVRTKDLGYNPAQIITTRISGNRDYAAIGNVLKDELSREPAIMSISYIRNQSSGGVMVNNKRIESSFKSVDDNYLPDVEIPLLVGRNFSPDFATDLTNSVIVNETFVNASNLSDPVGKSIELIEYEGKPTKTIIGVVKDFHFGSLRESIKPMVISMAQVPYGDILIKFQKSKQREAINELEMVYKAIMPNAVFKYDFLDELNAKQYRQELRWQKLVDIATLLAIIICCIGLLGMVHLSINQRIKEIGIRKLLGASVTSIVALLSKDFIRLVLIAIVIATPIAWYAMNRWLQGFAYRIDLQWWIFAAAGVVAVVIAMITVSGQSLRAAMADPVNSLRNE
ncbi:ABC transporter permease [Membranihabitans maritimus]|uniref:ABC transporter permease n=1 Tax=Membranihabitans maritimus TaxID=2904244 RepID=UPI001F2C55E6|nr:ABC transporter permease [Membranihabitans maritimus]